MISRHELGRKIGEYLLTPVDPVSDSSVDIGTRRQGIKREYSAGRGSVEVTQVLSAESDPIPPRVRVRRLTGRTVVQPGEGTGSVYSVDARHSGLMKQRVSVRGLVTDYATARGRSVLTVETPGDFHPRTHGFEGGKVITTSSRRRRKV